MLVTMIFEISFKKIYVAMNTRNVTKQMMVHACITMGTLQLALKQ